jgi:hypothetical protein
MASLGFDPAQPGARRLAAGYRAVLDRQAVRLERPFLHGQRVCQPGERIELPGVLAAQLIAEGTATRA